MALVMALGIMLVLAIALTTVITFSAAGARDSHRVNAGQKAYAIAEAGVNSAISQIASHYPNLRRPPSTWIDSGFLSYPNGRTWTTRRQVSWSRDVRRRRRSIWEPHRYRHGQEPDRRR